MNKFPFNRSTFRFLCSTLDSILFSPKSSRYIISIDWLHVLRPHPVFLRKYQSLFSPFPLHLLHLLASFFRNIVVISLDLLHALRNFNLFPPRLTVLKSPDIVFVTHLLDDSHLNLSTDFYYGDLAESLSHKGFSVVSLCINHTKSPHKALSKLPKISNHQRIILPVGRDSLFLLLNSLCWSLTSSVQLLSHLVDCRTYRQVLGVLFACANTFSRATRLSYFLRFYLNQLLYPSTKALVSTYEGFAWERTVFRTSHDFNSSILTFGYMHAHFFKDQHSAFRSLGHLYDPKYILTAGSTSREYLLNKLGLPESRVYELGSPRSISKGADSVYESSHSAYPTILVLPEGIMEECLLLFEFSLRCALDNPTFIFRWRTHPLISIDSVVKKIQSQLKLPPNIIVSKSSFGSDISASQYCLYRGSTAVLTAASSGVIPIYYKVSDFPDTDPLFCLSSHRPSVTNTSLFSEALQWNHWTSHSTKLCQQLYTPLNSNFFTIHDFI